MGTSNIVEGVDDKKGDIGSPKHLKNIEVKPLQKHGSSASSSSSSDSELDKSDQRHEFKSSTPFRVSFASSINDQSPSCYTPNRIPSSIFSRKPTMDWSAASNESLFSIQVGNVSFSRDQFFMLYKSGELTKLDEQIIAQGNVLPSLKELEDMASRYDENYKEKGSASAATEMPKNTAMAVETSKVAEDDHSHQKMPPAVEVQKPVSNNSPTVDLGAVADNHSQEKKFSAEVQKSPTNSISSGLSDESNNSTISFAFPV